MSAASLDRGVVFLEKLLMLSERNPDRTHPASGAPPYEDLSTANDIKRFEERISAAERAGAIEVRRGKRERRHLIERVRVIDAAALARHLGRPLASSSAQDLKTILHPIAAEGAAWVTELLNKMVEKWARGEACYRIDPSSSDQAREFMSLIAALSIGKAQGLDARTFALRVAGDSKAFDRNASRILQVLADRSGDERLSDDALWASIGLERYPHPVHVHGGLVAADASGVLVDGRATPFASFHPDQAEHLKVARPPTALVTIENFASFNRYVREMKDDAIVVYTGGFPSGGVMKLLNTILLLVGANVPFFHWGDIDPGGLRIFRFLEDSLPRAPLPHLMERSIAETFGQPAPADPTLISLANTDSGVASLASWLAEGEGVMHLEQEALDPRSPV